MKPPRAILKPLKALQAVALLALTAVLATAQPENPPDSPQDPRESLLQLLRERNIFNPNRQGPAREERETPSEPEPQRETLQLIGALTTPEQKLAFFDGSDSQYRRILNVGELIGEFKVTAITTSSVQLEYETNQIEVAVGSGLERVGENPWEMSVAPFRSTSPGISNAPASNDSPANTNADNASPAGSEENDILKRMLERRRQEASQ